MKKRLSFLISRVLVVIFACTLLNGCGVATTVGVVVAHNEIWKIKDIMIKTQRGITFDNYCINQSEMNADYTSTIKCRRIIKVKNIQPGSDAAKTELQVGDQITMIGGEIVDSGSDIRNAFF